VRVVKLVAAFIAIVAVIAIGQMLWPQHSAGFGRLFTGCVGSLVWHFFYRLSERQPRRRPPSQDLEAPLARDGARGPSAAPSNRPPADHRC
jgi:hypothetical protein